MTETTEKRPEKRFIEVDHDHLIIMTVCMSLGLAAVDRDIQTMAMLTHDLRIHLTQNGMGAKFDELMAQAYVHAKEMGHDPIIINPHG